MAKAGNDLNLNADVLAKLRAALDPDLRPMAKPPCPWGYNRARAFRGMRRRLGVYSP
jgi:hypothetical protein